MDYICNKNILSSIGAKLAQLTKIRLSKDYLSHSLSIIPGSINQTITLIRTNKGECK